MKKFTSNADLQFLFDPSGNPLNKLKVDAKKLFKAGGFEKLSESTNHLAKHLFNLPFNKLTNICKETSPFSKSGKIFIPFSVTDISSGYEIITFVCISEQKLCIEANDYLTLSPELSVEFTADLKHSSFEKIDNGWIVHCFNGDSKNIFFKIYKTNTAIVAELWEDLGEDSFVINSTYSYFGDLFHIYDHNDKYIKCGQSVDANELSVAVDHDEDSETELLSIAGYTAVLIGGFSISENGTQNSDLPYDKEQSVEFLKQKDAKEWARGDGAATKFPNHLALNTAIIDIVDSEGNIVKTLTEMPANLSQLALDLIEITV